jgi:DNA (cytosine-5)-methyltransferase 1
MRWRGPSGCDSSSLRKWRLNELALFAGAGGGILGGKLLGWRTVCAVERDAYAATVLAQRQNDGLLEPFPIWSDITTFDGRSWNGIVDVVSGGFPCQDISAAGKGAGIEGDRSGLWVEMARVIREVRPRFAFVENSPMLTSRGLGVVLGDLAEMGFDARWGVFGAVDAGAPHLRERIWIVADACGGRCRGPREGQGEQPRGAKVVGAGEAMAYPYGEGELQPQGGQRKEWRRAGDCCCALADPAGFGQPRSRQPEQSCHSAAHRDGEADQPLDGGEGDISWWEFEPALGRVAHGVDHRMDRLSALGNGQVPAVAALAWRTLTRC